MTPSNHPIQPPADLVNRWRHIVHGCDTQGSTSNIKGPVTEIEMKAFSLAAQWGADQELEACLYFVEENVPCLPDESYPEESLRANRRPKPQTLKEQALAELSALEDLGACNSEIIRRALEELPE